MSLLIKNGCIVTLDGRNQVIVDGAIFIENDKILDVGFSPELERKHFDAERIIDANGRVVMPGMICAHMHFYSAFATGLVLEEPPKGFLEILRKLWWKLDKALEKEDIYYSALLGCMEAVRNGTTTVVDHHASPSYVLGSLDEIERAARMIGVRSCLCYEVTNRNGEDEAQRGLEENRRFIEKCRQNNDDMFAGLLGLHASFTLGPIEMEESQRLVEKLSTGIHIHVAEGDVDMMDAKQKYGVTVVERLRNYNLLDQKSILAHCVHIENKDFSILKQTGVNVVHQPRSNMNNAVGSLDLNRFKEHGIALGLGTDGMSADMKAELMVGNLIHKHVQRDNTTGTSEIFEALFRENPRIIEKTMGVQIGSLQAGKKADILIADYYPRSPVVPDNVLGHIMFGVINGAIATTIINGRVCMEDRVLPGIDEKQISEKCQDLAAEVWERL